MSRSDKTHSTFKSGRTIGENREHLETAAERETARKKVKQKQRFRTILTAVGFLAVATCICSAAVLFFQDRETGRNFGFNRVTTDPYEPTIEIIDENSSVTDGKITSRMIEYIGQAEADFKDLGLKPTKAVIPTGAIREVDLYLDGYHGFIKLTTDRGTGVSAEDAKRMINYLSSQDITDFAYIDVRVDQKAFWKPYEETEEPDEPTTDAE